MSHPTSHPPVHSPLPGIVTFAVLAILTLVEYIVAIEVAFNIPFVMATSVLKAALIMDVFMHLRRTWRGAEGE